MNMNMIQRRAGIGLATSAMVLLTALHCKSTPVEPVVKPKGPDAAKQNREEQLKHIRAIYKPAACFRARYGIQFTDPKGKTQAANGDLRVDNQKQRMRFIFRATFLNITVGKITVKDDVAYINNPHARRAKERRMRIPVNEFYVRGPGNTAIPLPFRLFQDLLFARLPDDLFSPEAKVVKNENQLDVAVNRDNEKYDYRFVDNRLRKLNYLNLRFRNRVQVSLDGQYRDSIFPQSITMLSQPPSGRPSVMRIRFRSLDLKARCTDPYFPRW